MQIKTSNCIENTKRASNLSEMTMKEVVEYLFNLCELFNLK